MCADERQFERLLALHCAPVLKNRKASNMFHVEKDAFEDLHATLALYHEKLEKKGICLRLFQQNKERVTVFVYRRRRLSLLLQREDVRVFLQRYGYPSLGLSEILDHLDRRLDEAEGYPHEIGVFLGYPLYDVEPWSSVGIRQYVTRNDVILYSVDENRSCVYIRSVCTRGRNLDLHLSEQSESIE